MHFKNFKKILLKIRDYDLPGHDYLLKIAPPSRIKTLKSLKIPDSAKKASVILLFYPDQKNQPRFVLILRNTYKGVHSNQIGFPGGKIEKKDTSLFDTALRECEEEIGVVKNDIIKVRKLSPVYIPPSNYNVHPFVGYTDYEPNFLLDSKEVSKIIKPSFETLLNLKITKSKVIVKDDEQLVPSFIIDDHVVWGATAIMIHEFNLLFKHVLNS